MRDSVYYGIIATACVLMGLCVLYALGVGAGWWPCQTAVSICHEVQP